MYDIPVTVSQQVLGFGGVFLHRGLPHHRADNEATRRGINLNIFGNVNVNTSKYCISGCVRFSLQKAVAIPVRNIA